MQFTSTSQLPAGGGHAPISAAARTATSAACARFRACTLIEQPVDPSATTTARAAPPAPATATRMPASDIRSCSGARKPFASVLPPIQRPFDTRIVLIAPMRRATESTSSTASKSATLNGIVTLAPLMPMARANASKSAAVTAGIGR